MGVLNKCWSALREGARAAKAKYEESDSFYDDFNMDMSHFCITLLLKDPVLAKKMISANFGVSNGGVFKIKIDDDGTWRILEHHHPAQQQSDTTAVWEKDQEIC